MMTWQELIIKGYDLDLNLLQEIQSNLESGRKVRVGRKVLNPKKDIKQVQSLIKRGIRREAVK